MPRKWPLDAISQEIIVDLIIFYRRLEFGGDWTDRGCAMVKSRWVLGAPCAADGGWRTVNCEL
jgi:hypothetical protein